MPVSNLPSAVRVNAAAAAQFTRTNIYVYVLCTYIYTRTLYGCRRCAKVSPGPKGLRPVRRVIRSLIRYAYFDFPSTRRHRTYTYPTPRTSPLRPQDRSKRASLRLAPTTRVSVRARALPLALSPLLFSPSRQSPSCYTHL